MMPFEHPLPREVVELLELLYSSSKLNKLQKSRIREAVQESERAERNQVLHR